LLILALTRPRSAIEIGEKVLGKDHPDVAIRYNNLAIGARAKPRKDGVKDDPQPARQ